MDTGDLTQGRKRKSSDQDIRNTLQKFLKAKKQPRVEHYYGPSSHGECSSGPAPNKYNNQEKSAFIVRISPHSLDLPTSRPKSRRRQEEEEAEYKMVKSEDYDRLPFFLQNLSADVNEPRIFFTLYDIKDEYSTKLALQAKHRLRYTNVHGLICPQEKMFLTTACDYFQADYDDLIDYIDAIGEMRNKQIIVEHCYFKLFMHTLKMFYYTDKGWRFNMEFDEFFCGYMRKYREPIIEKMRQNWDNAKKAAQEAREAAQARIAQLSIKTDEV